MVIWFTSVSMYSWDEVKFKPQHILSSLGTKIYFSSINIFCPDRFRKWKIMK